MNPFDRRHNGSIPDLGQLPNRQPARCFVKGCEVTFLVPLTPEEAASLQIHLLAHICDHLGLVAQTVDEEGHDLTAP